MARPDSMELRERVVRAVDKGASRRATAARFEVSISFVVKLMPRWRRRGTVQPAAVGGAKRSALAAHRARVRALVTAAADRTIAELRHRLAAEDIAVSRPGRGRCLSAAGLTLWPTETSSALT
jgi:transposase